jgi:hypothetical protein
MYLGIPKLTPHQRYYQDWSRQAEALAGDHLLVKKIMSELREVWDFLLDINTGLLLPTPFKIPNSSNHSISLIIHPRTFQPQKTY